MHWQVLTNPYFLGYVLLVLLLRFGNMLRRMCHADEKAREATRATRERRGDDHV